MASGELNLTSDRKDENNNILKAKLIITPSGYRLLKGSYIEKSEKQSFYKKTYYKLRKQLENGITLDEFEMQVLNKNTDDLIRNRLRNRNTIEFLGIWKQLNNPNFKPVEFDGFRKSR